MKKQSNNPKAIPQPKRSWTEEAELRSQEGNKLPRYGSVQTACKMLAGCRRHELYDLIHAGIVKGFKVNTEKPNSHWRVDLLSVWEHKQRQLSEL